MSGDHIDGAAERGSQEPRRISEQMTSLLTLLHLRPAVLAPPLALRPLTPTPIADQHAVYSTELLDLLRDPKRRKNVWNIALSGDYGSGKSSILAGVRATLDRRVVDISLSSLSDIGVQPDASEEKINNLIQKEIVKQLLYRERPSKVPGSRFRRISRFPLLRPASASVLVGLVVAGLLWLTGWGAPLQLPPERESERTWLLLGIGAVVAVVMYVVQFLLHDRVHIDKLGAASTSVTLKTEGSGGDESFFDKYLDEIVYFFEMTRRDIVVFEDLDRYENPAIYASLRALNTVLNRSRQLRRRPVHFIYAVRDSIFEDLIKIKPPALNDHSRDEAAAPALPTPDRSVVWQADRTLSRPATQRTKFFDLVVPIVPFITHRTSRDLLVRAMEAVDTSVSTDVLSIVAKHITDMRLLLNIINEYRVFRTRVLAPNKLKGLTPDGLFAMITFKNTRLDDFELIRVGDSSLDRLYQTARKIIDAGLRDVASEIRTLEERNEPIAETQARAAQLGAALQALAERWLPRFGKSKQGIEFKSGNRLRTTMEIATPEFWAEVIDANTEIDVQVASGDGFHIDAAGLRAELGRTVPVSWAVQDSAASHKKLQDLKERQRWLRSADFRQLTESKRHLGLNEQQVDFRHDHLSSLGDPLLIELIARGYIDRNFHLYTSEFHGEVISANAKNFEVQHVQAEAPSFRYELTQDEIAAVLREAGPEAFGSVGLFNLAVYDKLLGADDSRLDRNIKLLTWVWSVGLEFINIYVEEGEQKEKLFRRLAAHFPGVFEYIAGRHESTSEEQTSLALAAFEGADPDHEYPAPEVVRDQIATGYDRLSELTVAEKNPTRAIRMLQRLGVRLPSLKGLSTAASTGIVTARQYVVTVENLRTALDDPDSIGLDVAFRTRDDVFDHVIAHFDEYLAALDSATPRLQSLQDTSTLVKIMSAVEQAEVGKSIEVLKRLPGGLRIEDLNDVPDNVMGVLAKGMRFTLTLQNVDIYITTRSLDESLVRFLESERGIDALGAEQAEQEALAAQIINEGQLTVDARMQLAKSITHAPITIAKISARDPKLIQSLLKEGLIADEPDTFAALDKSPDCQVAFIVRSKEAPTYFAQLEPSVAALEKLLCNDEVPSDIKNQIAAGLPQMPQNSTKGVIEALAAWALTASAALSPETIGLVHASSASASSKAAILNLSARSLAPDKVLEYTGQLPEPYSRLLKPSTKPVDLPASPNMGTVLQIIRADGSGPVSSWDQGSEVTRVWMRHPPKEQQ